MLKKISSYYFLRTENHLSRFLKHHASLVNIKKRSFYQLPALKKISFYSQKPIISTFPYPKNSQQEPFLSCKVIYFFFSKKLMFFLTILKVLLNLYYKKKCEAKLSSFLLSEFSMATCQFWQHQKTFETEYGTSILQKPKQSRQFFNQHSYEP